MTEETPLAAGFETLPKDRWPELAAAALNRKRPPEKQFNGEQAVERLLTKTVDGLTIQPLYRDGHKPLGRPGLMPFTRGTKLRDPQAPWEVRQMHATSDAEATRKAVLLDLERGVTGVWLHTGPGAVAVEDLPKVLADVYLDLAPITLSSVEHDRPAADALMALWAERDIDDSAAAGVLGYDPLGRAAREGTPAADADFSDFIDAGKTCLARYPKVRAGVVDARPYHDAGAGDVEEVACAIATGIAYLRAFEEAGVSPAEAVSQWEFRISATADQFLTIAKFRAMRRLWARVTEACDVPEDRRGAVQHAVTSWRMLTRDDPWVNMLRGTVACFSSAVGGAEAITVSPYDAVWGEPDVLTRRIARNTQILVAEESNVGRVTDPAGGSWYVEQLTDDLARRAWEFVQEIESAGGMAAALDANLIADRITAVAAERDKRLARRAQPITGVSTFPNPSERSLRESVPQAVAKGHDDLPGLFPRRDSEMFEALRDRSAAYAAKSGHEPAALLVCLGARREFGPREMFTANLLGVAGISTRAIEVASAEALSTQLSSPSEPLPNVAVLCSSAKVYADLAPDALAALRAAGIERVLMAGQEREFPVNQDSPGDRPDGVIFDGIDVVATLHTLLDEMGVAR
ncbi:methylmalonyl-CoA mutase subunit beta [Gephyromycinifex aptenodytis]|uniref:methylmalonyl-CoA mutase subunit beta n=1 Tax=Gephyromycinifex aptenodytis TaxID=2716227 RepID=UPI00144714FB|nr:methylmalonyl-CoA mutase subunit beta [Gephyromycinifex aptenodytis]